MSYIEMFKSTVEGHFVELNQDSEHGQVVKKIIDLLCEHDLMAYQAIAILERCALDVISRSKVKHRQ